MKSLKQKILCWSGASADFILKNLVMELTTCIALLAAGLIAARLTAELWLARLNRQHVLKHAGAVPEAFKEIIEPDDLREVRANTLSPKAGSGRSKTRTTP